MKQFMIRERPKVFPIFPGILLGCFIKILGKNVITQDIKKIII